MAQNELIAYIQEGVSVPLGCVFDGETLWLSQDQIANLFQTSKQVVSYHIGNIFETKEVLQENGVKEILTTVDKQGTRQILHYNLDVVIAVGYRVNSAHATAFRQWATNVLTDRLLNNLSSPSAISGDEQRVMIADRVAVENNELIQTARSIGVENDAAFLNAGYQGLYERKMPEIKAIKKLGSDRLLDRAGITELAANEFRITQVNDKLKRLKKEDGILVGHGVALHTHHEIGREIRDTIKRIDGVMPEDLPIEHDHISAVRRRVLVNKVKMGNVELNG